MKRFTFLILFICLSSHAFACICWFSTQKKSVKEKIKKADVIVYVTAVAESLIDNFQPGDSSLYVTSLVFKIEKVWKGENLKTIKFSPKRYPCEDAGYRVGERYIIFGYINQATGELETNNCNSLSEETLPDPMDKIKMTSKDFDFKSHQNATLQMRQQFEAVIKLIEKQTRT